MITFHHSFSTRIFLDENTSAEREARRAAAAAAIARATKDEARTPNELREFWWFLRGGEGAGKSLEGRAFHSTGSGPRASRGAARPRSGGSPTLHTKG